MTETKDMEVGDVYKYKHSDYTVRIIELDPAHDTLAVKVINAKNPTQIGHEYGYTFAGFLRAFEYLYTFERVPDVHMKVEDGMIVLYIDGKVDTNFGFGCNLSQVLDRLSPNSLHPEWAEAMIERWTPATRNATFTCSYCGDLDWATKYYGKLAHKHACPHRTDDFCQSHLDGCPA